MLDIMRVVIQALFSFFYGVIMVLTLVFVVPVVWLRERLAERKQNSQPNNGSDVSGGSAVVVMALAALSISLLAGCTVTINGVQQTVKDSASRSRNVLDRSIEFAQEAPPAPYDPTGDQQVLAEFATTNDLQLTGSELSRIAGASQVTQTDPALVATIVEQELRWLDDNELERDVLGALAGENSSIGLAQVRVSTAEELEQEDPAGVLPQYDPGDEARTERIRRLANTDWNILYASSYVNLLKQRYPNDQQLDLAQRYIGASPLAPRLDDQPELFELFGQIF